MATFRTTEILYIFYRNCYISQGDPNSSFPYLIEDELVEVSEVDYDEVSEVREADEPLLIQMSWMRIVNSVKV